MERLLTKNNSAPSAKRQGGASPLACRGRAGAGPATLLRRAAMMLLVLMMSTATAWGKINLSGYCGKVDPDNNLDGSQMTWTLTKSEGSEVEDVLTISGSGLMADYDNGKSPWTRYYKQIKTIVISDCIASIGNNAFYQLKYVTSDITLPVVLHTIGKRAFARLSTDSDNPIRISIPEQSSLSVIGEDAFFSSNVTIDLSKSGKLETIPADPLFRCVTGDIYLPSCLKLIEAKVNGKITAFDYFKGNHVYYPVPAGKTLMVNGVEYNEEQLTTDRNADLIGFLFAGRVRGISNGLSLSWKEIPEHTITTDGIVDAYHYGGNGDIITKCPCDECTCENCTCQHTGKAREGETVVLSWGGETVPKGQYVSGFTITKAGGGTVDYKQNEDNTDYTFVMPADDVTVATQTSAQEDFILDMTTASQVIIPETVYILMNTLGGYFYSELDAQGTEYLTYIDVNLDGTPDLQVMRPAYDVEVPEEEENEFTYEYSVKRLDGAVAANFRFTPIYPFPYKYNRIVVKLSNSDQVQDQPVLDELFDIDEYDNNVSLINLLNDGQPHNVMLSGRTLGAGKWNTLCLPFDLSAEQLAAADCPLKGATIRTLKSFSITTTVNIAFENVTKIESGKPYIVRFTGSDKVNPVFRNVIVTGVDPATVGINLSGVTFLGTYKPVKLAAYDYKMLFLLNNMFYYPTANDGTTVNPFRSYLALTQDVPHGSNTRIIIDFGDGEEQTGIIDTDFRFASQESGISDSRDGWYTLDGRRLSGQPTQKGLYIMNGNKTVIK